MRLIKSSNIESEYPKCHICDNCGAELEYDKEDAHIGWMGCEHITCLSCGEENMLDGDRMQRPTWGVTFRHCHSGVSISDEKIQELVNHAVREICNDDYKDGEFYFLMQGNTLVIAVKHDDGEVDVWVTQDYWEDSFCAEEYSVVQK